MHSHSLALPFIHRRRRAFFFACITQQVKSSGVMPEVLRAVAALATIAAWAGAFALVVG
jgi:hypothetical protein